MNGDLVKLLWLTSSVWRETLVGRGAREGGTPAVSDTVMTLNNQPNGRTPSGSLVRVLHRQLPSELSTELIIFLINGSIRKTVRSGHLSLCWTSVVVLGILHFCTQTLKGNYRKSVSGREREHTVCLFTCVSNFARARWGCHPCPCAILYWSCQMRVQILLTGVKHRKNEEITENGRGRD